MDRLTWISVGIATFVASEGATWGCDAFERFSKKSPKHATSRKGRNGSTPLKTWRGFEKTESRRGQRHWRSGVGTLFYLASQADPNWRDGLVEQPTASADKGPNTELSSKPELDTTKVAEETPSHLEKVSADTWPTMGEAAYHGIIGEVVRTIEPESEADPVAILIQLIVAVGNMISRQAYYQVESDKHHPTCLPPWWAKRPRLARAPLGGASEMSAITPTKSGPAPYRRRPVIGRGADPPSPRPCDQAC